MRHTVKDIRFYIDRLNSISKYRYRLDESNGYKRLVRDAGKGMTVVSWSGSTGEIYNVVYTAYTILYDDMCDEMCDCV